jgi:HSP20 family molecular chaperone IbpA
MTSGDPRAWMWTEALAMIDRAEQLHRRFFEPVLSSSESASWEPPIDIFETDQELWLIAALPGVEPGDLDVSIDADLLRIAGQRRLPAAARTAAIRRLEIPYGLFERQVRLPSTQFAFGRSELVNGCLVVSLSKRD